MSESPMINRLLKAFSEMRCVRQEYQQTILGEKTTFFFEFKQWPDAKPPTHPADEPTIVE